jgi:uncharacterized cupin superfamily protein
MIRITNKEAVEPVHKCVHEPYEYYKYIMTDREDNGQCTVALYELPPGKANYPYHYHMGSEEIFYIISGSGTLETPEGDKPIQAGDVIVCPAGEESAHRIVNTSAEKLTYLDCDTIVLPEVVGYPRSGKVGVMADGMAKFFKTGSDVGYYEGE